MARVKIQLQERKKTVINNLARMRRIGFYIPLGYHFFQPWSQKKIFCDFCKEQLHKGYFQFWHSDNRAGTFSEVKLCRPCEALRSKLETEQEEEVNHV